MDGFHINSKWLTKLGVPRLSNAFSSRERGSLRPVNQENGPWLSRVLQPRPINHRGPFVPFVRNSRVLSLRCQVSDLHRIAPINIGANFVTIHYTHYFYFFFFFYQMRFLYVRVVTLNSTLIHLKKSLLNSFIVIKTSFHRAVFYEEAV